MLIAWGKGGREMQGGVLGDLNLACSWRSIPSQKPVLKVNENRALSVISHSLLKVCGMHQ